MKKLFMLSILLFSAMFLWSAKLEITYKGGNLRASPGGTVKGQVAVTQTFEILEEFGYYAQVKVKVTTATRVKSGDVGYMTTKVLKDEVVTDGGCRFRDEPNKNGKSLGVLMPGDTVAFIKFDKIAWYKIKTAAGALWIYNDPNSMKKLE